MFAKICFAKFAQPLRRHFLRPRKIFLPQNTFDPDIDRKGTEAFVGKEHHTISDLCSYARQRAEVFSKIGIGKRRPRFQIGCA